MEYRKKQFMQTLTHIYSVDTNGKIYKKSKETLNEKQLKGYLERNRFLVHIGKKAYTVKRIVAKTFLKCPKGYVVINIDNNPINCNIKNLLVLNKRQLAIERNYKYFNSKPVIADGKRYDSISQCAKAYFVAYSSMNDYINGRINNSCLSGHKIDFEKKEGEPNDKRIFIKA